MGHHKINICRPGFGASCALCCGSHNYRCDRVSLKKLFTARADGDGHGNPRFLPAPYPRLFEDALQCPLVGFTDAGNSVLGCLRYQRPAAGDIEECSFTYTCKNFACRAMDSLTDEEILYAARLTADWYYYGLLINETRLLRDCMKANRDPDTVPAPARRELRRSLEISLRLPER